MGKLKGPRSGIPFDWLILTDFVSTREEQKDCTKIWSMKDSFGILRTGFWKSLIFELFPRVMSLMNGEAGAVFTIMVACLALEAIMKDQVEQLNTIGVAATAVGID